MPKILPLGSCTLVSKLKSGASYNFGADLSKTFAMEKLIRNLPSRTLRSFSIEISVINEELILFVYPSSTALALMLLSFT